MAKSTRMALALGSVLGVLLLAAWMILPGGSDLLSLDVAYIQEAQHLGKELGRHWFSGFDPGSIAFVIIKKGGVNYLVSSSEEADAKDRDLGDVDSTNAGSVGAKLRGQYVSVAGVKALRLNPPIMPVDVGTILPVRQDWLGQPGQMSMLDIPGKEMAAFTLGRTSLSGRFAAQAQVHRMGTGAQGFMEALAGPKLADEEVPSDLYVTFLVHEAFHVFQWDAMRSWMKEISSKQRITEGQGPSLEKAYEDEVSQELQRREGFWLSKAISAVDLVSVREYCLEFLKTRNERRQRMREILGDDASFLIELERVEEWSEGLARYAEILCWQIGGSGSYSPLDTIRRDPAFRGYRPGRSNSGFQWGAASLIEEIGQGIVGEGAWYTLGSGQCLVLDKLGSSWRSTVMKPEALEDLLFKEVDSHLRRFSQDGRPKVSEGLPAQEVEEVAPTGK